MNFILKLISELAANGKLLIAYGFIQSTLTSFPGLKTSFLTAIHDRTPQAWTDFLGQVLMAVAAAARAKKVIVNAKNK